MHVYHTSVSLDYSAVSWYTYILVLYYVGDIKSAANVTNLVVTQEIIVAWDSHAYTNSDLLPPIHDRLTQHPAVATVLLHGNVAPIGLPA